MSSLKVQNLARNLNFMVLTYDGIRSFGPSRFLLDVKPGNGSDLLIGRIPTDALEDELYPFFASVGDVYKIDLLLNIENDTFTKGVCIVTYMTPNDAIQAAQILSMMKFRGLHYLFINHVVLNDSGWSIEQITEKGQNSPIVIPKERTNLSSTNNCDVCRVHNCPGTNYLSAENYPINARGFEALPECYQQLIKKLVIEQFYNYMSPFKNPGNAKRLYERQ